MTAWEIVHDDGTVCERIEGCGEDYANAVVHYFDSHAAIGAPMPCGPHYAREAP